MNKLKSLKGNDYVLLLSAGASLGTLFLRGASYIFPEGEIKKPFNLSVLCLTEIFPDLIGEKPLVLNSFEYFTISFFFLIIFHF